METTIQSSASFSFRRVGMVADFYYPIIKKQLWFYPLVSVLAGFITFFLSYFGSYFGLGMNSFIAGLISMAMMFMYYWSPCILSNDGREIEVALPALWTEKAVFMLGYFLIFIPVILFVPMIIVKLVLTVVFLPETPLIELDSIGRCIVIAGFNLGVNSVEGLVGLTTALCVMLCSRKRSFLRAAVLSIVANIAVGFVSCFIIVSWIFSAGFVQVKEMAESDHLDDLIQVLPIDDMLFWTLLLSGIYSLVMIILSVRSIRKIQL